MAASATTSSPRRKRWRLQARDAQLLTRLTGASLAVSFAFVGMVFLLVPGRVLALFNTAGDVLGLPASPTDAFTLYLALAVGYMYVVTVLAVQMTRRPQVTAYPWVLVQAKAASALVCLVLFVAQDHYLVYLANAAVDGTIAALVWMIAVRAPARDDVPLATGRAIASTAAATLRRTAS
jgi:hypothetical protein